jgi:hypothetical protein
MEIFKFRKEDISNHIEYELELFDKFKEPLDYIINTLESKKHVLNIKNLDKVDINKIKEYEGKNYNWSIVNYKNATLVIRRYQNHLTIFTKVVKEVEQLLPNMEQKLKKTVERGSFTMHTRLISDDMCDAYYNNPFLDLNLIFKDLISLIIDRTYGVSWLWNSACIKIPDHIDVKLAFCQKNISSFDTFFYCMEELETFYQQLFSENTTILALDKLKINDDFDNSSTIIDISTNLKDDYYHAVGIKTKDKKTGKTKFIDVYALTLYYIKYIFKQNIYLYNGVVYTEGGDFVFGQPVAYSNMENYVRLFDETLPKENFIPLVKF